MKFDSNLSDVGRRILEFSKALFSTVILVSGRSIFKPLQLKKAEVHIILTDGGSSTFDKLLHPAKVNISMVFNKGGNLNVVKDLQSANAYAPILVTPSRALSFIVVSEVHSLKA